MGTAPATIFRPPFSKPAQPMPAIARPAMNILDEMATAQMSEPSSKTMKKARYVHCGVYKRRLSVDLIRKANLEFEMLEQFSIQCLQGRTVEIVNSSTLIEIMHYIVPANSVGASVPSNILQRVKFVCYARNCLKHCVRNHQSNDHISFTVDTIDTSSIKSRVTSVSPAVTIMSGIPCIQSS